MKTNCTLIKKLSEKNGVITYAAIGDDGKIRRLVTNDIEAATELETACNLNIEIFADIYVPAETAYTYKWHRPAR